MHQAVGVRQLAREAQHRVELLHGRVGIALQPEDPGFITAALNARVPVGEQPFGVAITPDGTHAYVANQFGNTVSVIETAPHTVVDTVSVRLFPTRVAITPDGTHAYVTHQVGDTVSVIETATHTVVATVSVGSGPIGVAITLAPSVEAPIAALIADIEALHLAAGVDHALISKLEETLANVQAGND